MTTPPLQLHSTTSLTISPVLQNFISIPNVTKNTDQKLAVQKILTWHLFWKILTLPFWSWLSKPKQQWYQNACNNFILMFNYIRDQHAPLRFASRKETRSFHKPWLIKGLLTSISKKNALHKNCYQQTTLQFRPSTNLTEIKYVTS